MTLAGMGGERGIVFFSMVFGGIEWLLPKCFLSC